MPLLQKAYVAMPPFFLGAAQFKIAPTNGSQNEPPLQMHL